MSYKMSIDQREAFLQETRVAVIGVQVEGRGPVLLPVWYKFEPGGEIEFLSNKGSKKIELIKKAGRLTVCVQDEKPPYKFVSVEGELVSIEPADRERDLVPLARRYLGKEAGDHYVRDTEGVEEMLIRIRPRRWSSADYS